MRRLVITVLAALAVVLAVGGAVVAGTGGGSTVTQARLERALPQAFAHLYADQAHIIGHPGITPTSLHAKAMCDKGGAVEPNVGPGSNWNCLVSWTDPNMPMPPEGYGKFELQVHTNGCYTAGGPSKLVGYQTIADTEGRQVTNPVYEFDGCFDPDGSNSPTGVRFPSLLNTTTTALLPDPQRRISLAVSCGTGSTGCVGSVNAKAGDTDLGTVPVKMLEEQTANLHFPKPVPSGADSVDFTLTTTRGTGPKGPVSETSLDMPPS